MPGAVRQSDDGCPILGQAKLFLTSVETENAILNINQEGSSLCLIHVSP